MLQAFSKGIEQLSDRNTRKFLWLAIAAAIGTFVVLWSAIGFVLTETTLFTTKWLEASADILGAFTTLLLTWFLFPAAISVVIGFFLDDIIDSVEARHYPGIAKAAGQRLNEVILTSLKFFGILVALNFLMLPFLFLGPGFPVIFYTLNGYLLGREYFELVASRRLDAAGVTALRKQNSGRLLLVGIVIAFGLTVPLLNLLMPVIATAAVVHLYQSWRPSDTPGASVVTS